MKASRTGERSKAPREIYLPGKGFEQCRHDILDRLVNNGDELIAEVCKGCGVRIAEYGPCTGCSKHKRLIRFGANNMRFCNGACESRWALAEKKRKATEARQPYLAKRHSNGHD